LIWRRGLNLWHILLIGVNCLLLLAIVHIWWGDSDVPALASRPGKGPELPKAPLLRDQQPLTAFRVVAAKDLFTQERRGSEQDQPAKPQASLEGRQLMGTMIIGSERVALISNKPTASRVKAEAAVDVVRQGEDFDGYKVLEISSEAVVLEGKDGKQTLNFPE
jgi:hypothetical protein